MKANPTLLPIQLILLLFFEFGTKFQFCKVFSFRFITACLEKLILYVLDTILEKEKNTAFNFTNMLNFGFGVCDIGVGHRRSFGNTRWKPIPRPNRTNSKHLPCFWRDESAVDGP